MPEFQSLPAMEGLMATTSRDTWTLADALVADIPGNNDGETVGERLTRIVAAARERELVTPNGDLYTEGALWMLRKTALAWPVEERHPEAAYRTHLEARGTDSRGRVVLAALCAYARNDTAPCPKGVNAQAFLAARRRVAAKAARGRRFPVSANDLRLALGNAENVPLPTTVTDVAHMLRHVDTAVKSLRSFRLGFAAMEIDEQDKHILRDYLLSLLQVTQDILEVVNTTIDDAALAELIEEEAR